MTTTSAATGVEAFISRATTTNIARLFHGDSYDQGVMIGIDDCAANDVISLKAITTTPVLTLIDKVQLWAFFNGYLKVIKMRESNGTINYY